MKESEALPALSLLLLSLLPLLLLLLSGAFRTRQRIELWPSRCVERQ